jgi:type II secretory pathway component PulL
MLEGVIIIPPIIVPATSGDQGPVPWWFWLVLAGAVALFLVPVGWMAYSDWRRQR